MVTLSVREGMMTVYIEYVIIDNFVIDYMLLKATFAITGSNCSKTWLFLCAIIGAGFALLIPLMNFNSILVTLIKIVFGLLLVVIAGRYKSVKEYYINFLIFILLTFAVGGSVIGIYSMLGIDYSSEVSIAVMVLPVYVLIKIIVLVIKFIYKRKNVMTGVFETEITVENVTKKCKGFLDTGNGLYDGDSPVIVCGIKLAKELLVNALKKPLKKITVNTATGQSMMFAVKTQSVKIYIWNKEHIFNNVTLCVTKNPIGVGYDVILHPALFKENCLDKRKISA